MAYTPVEIKDMGISLSVIITSILAIVAFAYSATAVFYILAVVAVALGLYMAYALSKESTQQAAAQVAAQKGKRRR